MIRLPDEIFHEIFSFLFHKQHLFFLKGLKLHLHDYAIFNSAILHRQKLILTFLRKTYLWRLKIHTNIVNSYGNGATSIYEIKFEHSLKDLIKIKQAYCTFSKKYMTLEFITDNLKKSKKVLENIKCNYN